MTDNLGFLRASLDEAIGEAEQWFALSDRTYDDADRAADGAEELSLKMADAQRREAVAALCRAYLAVDGIVDAVPDRDAVELQRKIGRLVAEAVAR